MEYKTNWNLKHGKDWQKYSHLLQQYERYKRNYARNIKFDIDSENLSKYQNKGLDIIMLNSFRNPILPPDVC